MWFELFTLGSLPFWFFIASFIALEMVFVEQDGGFVATVFMIGILAILGLFSDTTFVIKMITHNPWGVIMGIVIYLIVGIIYSIPRWALFVKDQTILFNVQYKAIANEWNTMKRPSWYDYATFEQMLRATYYMPPMPWDRGNKSKIYTWLFYWPISGLWVLLNRPIQALYNWIYSMLKGYLEYVSNQVFKQYINK